MRIRFEDGTYKGTHIPGPSHNYLGITFVPGGEKRVAIEVLPPIGKSSRVKRLTADEVRPWIEEGIRIAESEIGRRYTVLKAEIFEDDSRRPEVYRELARRITVKHHTDQMAT